MKSLASLVALAFFGGAPPLVAADEAPNKKPAETTPAPALEKVYLPKELDALRSLIGQKVTIEGKLERQGANKGQTIRYLNFTPNYRDSVALVFFTEKGGESFAKATLTEWLGRKVRATGTLAEFNGNLQIEIEKWEQLQEIPEPPPADAPQPAEPAKTP